MRLWGDKTGDGEEGEQPAAPPPNPLEKALLGMVASNPQVQEAIKSLLGMIDTYTQTQVAISWRLKEQGEMLGEIKLMLLRQGMSQPGAKVPLEGMVADGTKCPICNSTEACECFSTQQTGGDNGQET